MDAPKNEELSHQTVKPKSVGKRLILCLGSFFGSILLGCLIGLPFAASGMDKIAEMIAASILPIAVGAVVTTWSVTSPKHDAKK